MRMVRFRAPCTGYTFLRYYIFTEKTRRLSVIIVRRDENVDSKHGFLFSSRERITFTAVKRDKL